MAEVFLGSTLGAEGFTRRVAIKRVLPGYSDNPAFAQMFVAEAQLSARLQHPNIVSVLDFDRDADGRLFLVMELVEGRDLDALTSSGLLPFPVVIFVISEILRGLGHAHDLPSGNSLRGIVHRDVSPHNVLLSWEGAVKVSDFGIAKARQASEATASVFIKGKPAYMSPEQANSQKLDGRSDLFAVGVMMWEMLVGRRLFVGEDTRATLAAVLFGQIPRPRAVRGDIPKDLERVTMKLLERDLPSRFATAEQAITALLECKSAAKNGREQLIRVMAERFPKHAPGRETILTQGASGTPGPESTPPHPSAGPVAPTIGYGSQTEVPSLGELRNATTGSIHPMATVTPPRRRGMRIALVIAGLAAAAAIVVGLRATSQNQPQPPRLADAGVVVAEPARPDAAHVATAPVETAVAVDAAVAAVSEAPEPPKPARPEPPKKDARVVHSSEKRMGRLVVRAFPVLTVYVDNKKIHDTPVDMNLPAGKHKLRLVNSEVGKDESVHVTIEENKTATIERN